MVAVDPLIGDSVAVVVFAVANLPRRRALRKNGLNRA